MRPDAKPDTRVAALLARHRADDPAQTITRLCSDLIDVAGATVPVNLEVLASFRNARVTVLDLEQAETIMWDGRHFVIRVRRADTDGRQRFSCAHGIIHTFFMEAGSSLPTGGTVLGSWSRQEEDLCDQGAAELLLPRAAFIDACPPRPDMDDVLELAEVFDASAEATALRMVALATVPAAMIVLEPSLKPADLTHIARRQSQRTLPGLPHEDPIAPRLRVQKSLGHELPFIPRYKSIDDSTPLADVLSDGTADYVGETGLVPGRLRVSARLLPIRRGGVLVNRVVALLFDADRERHYEGVRQSG
jgi:Zn-dependent peptidase ImmA (M78 family)